MKAKTVWRLYVNYGRGYEYELTEKSLRAGKKILKSARAFHPAKLVRGKTKARTST